MEMALAGIVFETCQHKTIECWQTRKTYLGVANGFEEGCDSDETDIIVPHHCPFLVLVSVFERVLEDCPFISHPSSKGLRMCRRVQPTLEAVSTGLYLKPFFLTAVRNVPRKVVDSGLRMHAEALELLLDGLVVYFERWKVDVATDDSSFELRNVFDCLDLAF